MLFLTYFLNSSSLFSLVKFVQDNNTVFNISRHHQTILFLFIHNNPILTQPISSSPPSNSPRQLHILRHNSHSLCVNGTQIRVLKQPNQIRLGRLLQRQNRLALEPQVTLVVTRNLPDHPLKRQRPYQKISRLLKLSYLPQSHGPGSISVRFFDPLSHWSRLPCRHFVPDDFTRGLGGCCGLFTRGLLCSCH